MTTTQPEELRTLEQKVEDARNLLTSIEQDQIRLSKMRVSEEYTLGELNKSKIEVQGQIDSLFADKESLSKGLESAKLQITENTDALRIILETLESARETLSKEKVDNEAARQTLQDAKVEHESRATLLSSRESELNAREESVTSKETKIKDLIKDLS